MKKIYVPFALAIQNNVFDWKKCVELLGLVSAASVLLELVCDVKN